ncbi:MAG: hypothetical protein Q7W13_17555 [Bacteroidia bacterium]|nr:hypothetical protein [Bacteroidia bacterium]
MKKLIFLIVLFFSYAFSAQENKTKSTENKKTTSVEVKKLEDVKMPEDANKDKSKINEKAKSENLEKEIYNLITIK